jgi:hypothetical protein
VIGLKILLGSLCLTLVFAAGLIFPDFTKKFSHSQLSQEDYPSVENSRSKKVDHEFWFEGEGEKWVVNYEIYRKTKIKEYTENEFESKVTLGYKSTGSNDFIKQQGKVDYTFKSSVGVFKETDYFDGLLEINNIMNGAIPSKGEIMKVTIHWNNREETIELSNKITKDMISRDEAIDIALNTKKGKWIIKNIFLREDEEGKFWIVNMQDSNGVCKSCSTAVVIDSTTGIQSR